MIMRMLSPCTPGAFGRSPDATTSGFAATRRSKESRYMTGSEAASAPTPLRRAPAATPSVPRNSRRFKPFSCITCLPPLITLYTMLRIQPEFLRRWGLLMTYARLEEGKGKFERQATQNDSSVRRLVGRMSDAVFREASIRCACGDRRVGRLPSWLDFSYRRLSRYSDLPLSQIQAMVLICGSPSRKACPTLLRSVKPSARSPGFGGFWN